MKTVDGYISDLLFKHDCVILPEFGGFVASYAPAVLSPSKHTLHPPSKDILFNARLQKNDGLLANHIAEQEQISYSDAMHRLREFTGQCMSSLQAQETVVFQTIGTFLINREGKIEFTPSAEINYLEDAYGLTCLVSPPLHGKQRKTRQAAEVRKKVTRRSPGKKSTVPYLALAALFLAATALWGYYHSPLLKDIYTHYSGIIPLIRATRPPSHVVTVNEPVIHVAEESITPVVQPTPIPEEPKEEPVADVTTTEPAPQAVTTVSYHIIAGAFQDPDNAESLIGKLRNRGYDAQMAGQTKGGLHRVSYGKYPDRKQAIQNLEKIHLNENPDAWLFVK